MIALTAPARADISVRASLTPQRAQVGEPLTLSIDISGAQGVGAPAIGDIDGLSIQYAGPSTQISIINGRMNASVQHRYSVVPMREGHFTLGPFTIDYEGKRYQTTALNVDVVAAGQPPQQSQRGAAPKPGGSGTTQPEAAGPRTLRLTLTVPNQQVYLHERLPLDVTLYVGQVRVADVQYPTLTADGLSVDKFPEPSQQQQVIDGTTYQVLHFQTTVIPMRAGTLPLAATLQLSVLNRRRDQRFSDPFFEHFFADDPFSTERRPLDLRSDPVTLTVLPLPEDGKPPSFSGAVGTFALDVGAAPTQLNAGDPITLHMTLTGSGNLSDAGPPSVTDTDGFRTYEPHAGKADGSGASITKTFEQVLIPNAESVRAIPPVRFSYFDPQARRYQTVESQPIALVVSPQPKAPGSDVVAGPAARRLAPEENLGRDIVYIKDDPGRLRPRAARPYRSLAFLLWQPVPLALFAAAIWFDRRRQRLSGDLRYARFSRAAKEARRGLAAANEALRAGDRQAFYDTVSRTMQEYLAAKLDLPPGAIDADAVAGRGVPGESAQRIRTLFDTCEHVRFAPSANDGDMRGTLSLAEDIIKRLERERRLAQLRFRLALLVLTALGAWAAHAAEPAPASPQTTFFHANALYKDGQYEAAAREYAQLVQAGLASGNLYFNLGNAYFKAGEKGTAILNYERARHVMPADPDLAANLAYVQSLTGASGCTPAFWQRLVFPLAHRAAIGGLLWAATGLYSALFLSLAVYRVWPRRPRWLLYAVTGAAIMLFITTTSLAHQLLAEEWQRQAVVVAGGETPARFEPAASGTVHFVLQEGSLVRLLDTRDGWLQVARCDGRRGWVAAQSIETL